MQVWRTEGGHSVLENLFAALGQDGGLEGDTTHFQVVEKVDLFSFVWHTGGKRSRTGVRRER